jgi:ubiquinone/menaquinone biosynthesis C-methylase UbiE
MKEYLTYPFDKDDKDLVSIYDELPLWAAPFGFKLLAAVKMKPDLRVLDVGCGTGFPLIELAQRLGRGALLWGIDPWWKALERIQLKLRMLGITNVQVTCGEGEQMPFLDDSFGLIVTNNGINNVQDPERVLQECGRVSVPGAQLLMTMNLGGTMMEFYDVFRAVLNESGDAGVAERLHEHIKQRRMPMETLRELLKKAKFKIQKISEDSFCMTFADGEALFWHHFIRCNFLKPWMDMVREEYLDDVFASLEERLTKIAKTSGMIKLTIPFACLDCRKL